MNKLQPPPRNEKRDLRVKGDEIKIETEAIAKAGCQARLDRVKRYIEANISGPISLADLASVAALSPYHFSRAFKRCAGITPVRYILKRRVSAAKRMLADETVMHAEVAYSCGFASESHFCTSFKLITGMTATAWRKMVATTAASLTALWTDIERAPPMLI